MPSFFGLRIFTIKNDENVMSGEMTDTWVNMPRAYDTDKSIIWETRVGDRYYPDQNKRGRVPNKRGFSKNAGLNASEKNEMYWKGSTRCLSDSVDKNN